MDPGCVKSTPKMVYLEEERIQMSSRVKTSGALGGIFGGIPCSPYPSSGGMKSCHRSPGFMSCSAWVSPRITALGVNTEGWPRE
eukprot:scaffold25172_cov33-Tisochrysis_lutea.AAC.3